MSELAEVRDADVVGRESEAITDETLEDHARNINFLKREAATSAISFAVRIGRELIKAKEKCEHGTWGTWLKENVDYSQDTANNLMRVSREYGSANYENYRNLPFYKLTHAGHVNNMCQRRCTFPCL